MADTKSVTITDVFNFFSDGKTNGLTLGQFSKEWKQLDEKSKNQIKQGIGDGTLNY